MKPASSGGRLGQVVRLVTSKSPEPAMDDAALLASVRAHDERAAAMLYRRVQPKVAATVARLLGERDPDYDDLIQISIVELVRSIDSFRGECSLDAWTGGVTARAVYKELRRRKSGRKYVDRSAYVDSQFPGPTDASEQQIARSTLERIRTHIAELDPLRAWTLLLHDVAGHDVREVAAITGQTLWATRSRLVRARNQLREIISADSELSAALLQETRGRP